MKVGSLSAWLLRRQACISPYFQIVTSFFDKFCANPVRPSYPDFIRVNQNDWETPKIQDWVDSLQRAVIAQDAPVIFVAHSLACSLVAHWALRHSGPVAGALLVAPSDVEAPNYPSGTTGFAPMPLKSLSFRSIVVASEDDEYVSLSRGRYFAECWKSEYVLLGARGHIGSASKLGMWPEEFEILNRMRGLTPNFPINTGSRAAGYF
jgi:uncharacterized protein